MHNLKNTFNKGCAFTSLQANNRLLSTIFERLEHLSACFNRVGFSVFIALSTEEKVKRKQKNQGCFQPTCITFCFDALKLYNFCIEY